MSSVSIVLHVMDDDRYLARCLDSILAQTLHDLEVLCFHTHASTHVLPALEEFERSDKRVKILDGKFDGVAEARNAAMCQASGDYLLFLNSLDRIDERALERLVTAGEGADVIAFGVREYDGRTCIESETRRYGNPVAFGKTFISPREHARSLFSTLTLEVCSKLFRREYVERSGIRFPHLPNASHVSFSLSALWHAERIACIDEFVISHRSDVDGHRKNRWEEVPFCFVDALTLFFESLGEGERADRRMIGFYDVAMAVCDEWIGRLLASPVLPNVLQRIADAPFSDFEAMGSLGLDRGRIERFCGIRDALACSQRRQSAKRPPTGEVVIDRRGSDSPAVSIVVPVYNSERYLSGCLESICSQGFADFEVVCVDDGSTDSSPGILAEFAHRDQRIAVLSQRNAGQSCARNLGVRHARGKYLLFVDSDDTIHHDALSILVPLAEQEGLDLLRFRLAPVCDGGRDVPRYAPFLKSYAFSHSYSGAVPGPELASRLLDNNEYLVNPFLQIIRRDLFEDHGLWFRPGIIHEDNLFTLRLFLCARRAMQIDEVLYFRSLHDGSTMMTPVSFENAYGYFMTYLLIQDALKGLMIEERHYVSLLRVQQSMLSHAIANYRRLKCSERWSWWGLDQGERLLFDSLIAAPMRNEWVREGTLSQLRSILDVRRNHITARIDVALKGLPEGENVVEIVCQSDELTHITTPLWLQDGRMGYVIESMNPEVSLDIVCVSGGTLNLTFRGRYVKDANNNKNVPHWIYLRHLVIDGDEILDGEVPVWHDRPYEISIPVEAGEVIPLYLVWDVAAFEQGLETLRPLISNQEEQIVKLNNRVAELEGSRAYRLGSAIAWPLRQIRRITQGNEEGTH